MGKAIIMHGILTAQEGKAAAIIITIAEILSPNCLPYEFHDLFFK